MEKKTEINFSKTVDTDDIDDVIAPLNGIFTLLDGLAFLETQGQWQHTKEAYAVIQMACHNVVKDLEEIKQNVDYMQEKIREGR